MAQFLYLEIALMRSIHGKLFRVILSLFTVFVASLASADSAFQIVWVAPAALAPTKCTPVTLRLKTPTGFAVRERALDLKSTSSVLTFYSDAKCRTRIKQIKVKTAKRLYVLAKAPARVTVTAKMVNSNLIGKKLLTFIIRDEESRQLSFGQVSQFGIFDPSITMHNNTAWMTYSSVNHTTDGWLYPDQFIVSTRIASSQTEGVSWSDSGIEINAPTRAYINRPGYPTTGVWHHEVSSITYDPYALPSERWRILWQHYLLLKKTDNAHERSYSDGWIAFKAAATPLGLAQSTEVKLFTTRLYQTVNNDFNGATGSPVGGEPVSPISEQVPALSNCLILTEPALLPTAARLYVALLCIDNPRGIAPEDIVRSELNNRIILLSCDQPCRMSDQLSNWQYIGDLLSKPHATQLGEYNFSAPNLMQMNGKTYLTVSAVENDGETYRGCYTFAVSDLNNAFVNVSQPLRSIIGAPGRFNGACASHARVNSGRMYYSEINPLAIPDNLFQIRYSGQSPF